MRAFSLTPPGLEVLIAPFYRPVRIRGQSRYGQVAQLVEQRTENPCVGGSIPPLATRILPRLSRQNLRGAIPPLATTFMRVLPVAVAHRFLQKPRFLLQNHDSAARLAVFFFGPHSLPSLRASCAREASAHAVNPPGQSPLLP